MNKSKMPIIAVIGALIVVIVVVAFFAFGGDESEEAPAATPDQNQSESDGGDQEEGDAAEDDSDQGDDGAENENAAEAVKAELDRLEGSLQTLETDLDAALTAGCGDDLDQFNQNVVGLVTRLGEAQEGMLALGGQIEALDQSTTSAEDQAAVTEGMESIGALMQSAEAKHEQLAELSNTCNAAG